MGEKDIKTLKLNSIRDNNKFEISSVKILYSLPINTFTLINDDEKYLSSKSDKIYNQKLSDNNDQIYKYRNKQNSNIKNDMLKSYDLYLSKKYNIILNQKTIERVKNFFQ